MLLLRMLLYPKLPLLRLLTRVALAASAAAAETSAAAVPAAIEAGAPSARVSLIRA